MDLIIRSQSKLERNILTQEKSIRASVREKAGQSLMPLKSAQFRVPIGQLTFDLEGLEASGSRFHSRVPHIPSAQSGITLGRGYDLGQHSASAIKSTLTMAGLAEDQVEIAVSAAGLTGLRAHQVLPQLALNEITPEQQRSLFMLSYQEMVDDVRRIVAKQDIVATYGRVEWDQLAQNARDVIVDLRFRGDYTADTRKILQPFLVTRDYVGLTEVLSDSNLWIKRQGVPEARFQARIEHLAELDKFG